jgi:hypothetical protein
VLTTYPAVLSEDATLALVCAGRSIARYGDGEFKLALGRSIKSQIWAPSLQQRLVQILQRTPETCLVGIPNILSDTPKAAFWGPFTSYAHLLAERRYVSSFITRPDSAPWVDTPDYWAALEGLWKGHDVTLVRGSGKSLTADELVGARTVTEIICPRQNAWASRAELLERIGTPRRALLCCGPTATVLAVDLALRGVHAIDLGHVGLFLKKHRAGLPMWVSKADKENSR